MLIQYVPLHIHQGINYQHDTTNMITSLRFTNIPSTTSSSFKLLQEGVTLGNSIIAH